VVILGAHLDSWDFGTGALDNGCNAALVIEAARAIKASGLAPRRTIRFVLFSGEEQGTVGSYEYVKTHRAELDKIRAMITFDSGIGRVTGYSMGGRRDLETGLREILKPIESWGSNKHTYDASFGTDNLDFLLKAFPRLWLIRKNSIICRTITQLRTRWTKSICANSSCIPCWLQ